MINPDVITTSQRPRYALTADFAVLFDGELETEQLYKLIKTWQEKHLTPAALARLTLIQQGVAHSKDAVFVNLPNGETRKIGKGASALLCKAIVETFSKHFVQVPALILLSEPSRKILLGDGKLAQSIGLKVTAEKHLPDVILADLSDNGPYIIFVEAVVTDGPISEERKAAFEQICVEAGISSEHVFCVTAFAHKHSQTYRKYSSEVAWNSFVWFSSDPENLIVLKGEVSETIKNLKALR